MQAYMKSSLPFHGVHAPEARQIYDGVFRDVTFDTPTEWESTLRYLWDRARFREERYGVIALAQSRASRPFQTPRALRLYEHLIVTGAWWDYVDEVAIRGVGPILRRSPRPVGARMRTWSRSSDLWKRRTAIICQVGSKSETDLDLLTSCIEAAVDAPEFFLRKAIGWALRQQARVDPHWVVAFVASHADRLSPLSQREALRHLSPPTVRTAPTRTDQ
jgi:3-methyladenine DNA glycosylase AlkD